MHTTEAPIISKTDDNMVNVLMITTNSPAMK